MNKINIASRANVVDEDGIMWLADSHFNGLFKFEIETKMLEFVGLFDNNLKISNYVYEDAYIDGKEVIFVPGYGREIGIYDKQQKKFKVVEVPVLQNVVSFLGSVKYKDSIYFLSDDLVVWEYKIKQKFVVENKKITALCKEFSMKTKKTITVTDYDSEMFLFDKNTKMGCRIDFKTSTVYYLQPKSEEKLERMWYDGERYWFSLFESLDVMSWNGKQSYKVYKADNNEWGERRVASYSKLKNANGQVFFSNFYAKYIMKINEEKQTLEQAFEYPEGFKVLRYYKGFGPNYKNIYLHGNYLIIVPHKGNMLLFYNLEQNHVEGIKLEISKKEIPQFETTLLDIMKSEILEEKEGIIEWDDLLNSYKKERHLEEECIGKKIWYKCNL